MNETHRNPSGVGKVHERRRSVNLGVCRCEYLTDLKHLGTWLGMGRPPKDPVEDCAKEISAKTGIPEGTAKALLGELAMYKDAPPGQRWSAQQLCQRYGTTLADLNVVKGMGRVVFDDIREGLMTKAALIHNKAQDALMDRLNDPAKMDEIKTPDLARIAKLNIDTVQDLAGVGGSTVINFNLGEVQELKKIGETLAKKPPLEERLAAKGIKVVEAEASEPEAPAE